MPALVHVAKLGDRVRGKRRLVGGLGLALLAGLAVAVGITLYLGYTRGAFNFRPVGPFSSGPKKLFDSTVARIRTPAPAAWGQIGFLGVGTAAMGALTLLRYRFSRWPVNPIGLIVGGSYWAHFYLTSIFLAWFAKFVILKTGGAAAYQRFRPFFLGLVVGYSLGILIMFLMDVIWFMGSGHRVHTW